MYLLQISLHRRYATCRWSPCTVAVKLLALESHHTVSVPFASYMAAHCSASLVQVAQLAADLLQGLPNGIVDKLTVVFADEDAAQAAEKLQQHAKRRYKAIYLGDAFLDGISGMLLLVGPTKDQVISTAAAILAASTVVNMALC